MGRGLGHNKTQSEIKRTQNLETENFFGKMICKTKCEPKKEHYRCIADKNE